MDQQNGFGDNLHIGNDFHCENEKRKDNFIISH